MADDLNYAFIQGDSPCRAGGWHQIRQDVEYDLRKRLGPPSYETNDANCLKDSTCVVVAVNPIASCLFPLFSCVQQEAVLAGLPIGQILNQPLDRQQQKFDRWVGIGVPNGISSPDEDLCQIVLSGPFAPVKARAQKEYCHTYALPSRVTPERIRAAAQELCLTRPELAALPRPITTVLIGDLSWRGWSSANIVERMALLREGCGGSVISTSSPRTNREDEELFVKEMKPAYHYSWHTQTNHTNNPFLGLLGLADEVWVTGESLSMVSDVLASEKHMRLVHGWPVVKDSLQTRFERFTLEAFGCLSPVKTPRVYDPSDPSDPRTCFTNKLLASGFPTIFDASARSSPTGFHTGYQTAINTIAGIIQKKMQHLRVAADYG